MNEWDGMGRLELVTFGAGIFLCPAHCSMFGVTFAVYTLDTRSTALHRVATPNNTHYPLGYKIAFS